ncbi:glycoside hydrolase family 88 protein [Pedobacter sandarakinus]|uniref:glycoside hydrolase family 88 protein n=1 Tax=Pedobacter sandarakinus TaxID=353156 RepID=UPI002247707C|nr:glycoside hydrolase family 88 protein [Pedobacter sandarakinus]MCX2574171.1 glycoside hydrolase family 88 protein [Pedobacter sandarakinus]
MKLKLVGLFMLLSATIFAQKPDVKHAMQAAMQQTELLVKNVDSARKVKPNLVSPRTVENGEFKMVASKDWTSGFFPAQLWFYYEYSKDKKWLALAKKYTEDIKKEQYNKGTHDLGFMIYCPFGNGYRFTKDGAYRDVIIQAAKSLSTRFNAKAGVIKSWDHNTDKWKYPVIIDNMMNLELLFEATKLTGDSSFYKIAISHAEKTKLNHYRPDFSSYHVVDYDTVSGDVRNKLTAQGFANSSAWARGQAWGLYGFTRCYYYTKNKAYLAQADAIANFILSSKITPEDGVPYWDYNDPKIPNVSRDASAAAITASALYELAKFSKANSKRYESAADKIMVSLSTQYVNQPQTNYGFLLAHSTGHRPANSEIDVPINYADYYYIEALLRSKNMVLAK